MLRAVKTISREDFVAAIEAGIENSPALTASEQANLRHVARTEPAALVGLFVTPDCGCPLTLAGLYVESFPLPERFVAFYRGFDRFIDSDDARAGADKVVVA